MWQIRVLCYNSGELTTIHLEVVISKPSAWSSYLLSVGFTNVHCIIFKNRRLELKEEKKKKRRQGSGFAYIAQLSLNFLHPPRASNMLGRPQLNSYLSEMTSAHGSRKHGQSYLLYSFDRSSMWRHYISSELHDLWCTSSQKLAFTLWKLIALWSSDSCGKSLLSGWGRLSNIRLGHWFWDS